MSTNNLNTRYKSYNPGRKTQRRPKTLGTRIKAKKLDMAGIKVLEYKPIKSSISTNVDTPPSIRTSLLDFPPIRFRHSSTKYGGQEMKAVGEGEWGNMEHEEMLHWKRVFGRHWGLIGRHHSTRTWKQCKSHDQKFPHGKYFCAKEFVDTTLFDTQTVLYILQHWKLLLTAPNDSFGIYIYIYI